jgi:hypothetical protein
VTGPDRIDDDKVAQRFDAALDLFAEMRQRVVLLDDDDLRLIHTAVAHVVAATVAEEFEALAAHYPEGVFTPAGTSRDAVSGTALRTVLSAQAKLWRAGQ